MAVEWGSWEYSGGNGMRVGVEVSVSSVSHSSSSVTFTYKVWTQNQYSYSDDQQLNYGGNSSGSTSFHNGGGEDDAAHRATKTYTYNYSSSSYGSSPGSTSFSATLSGAFNGVTPTKTVSDTIPARPYGAPDPPTSCVATRTSDTSISVSWTRHATTGEPYSAIWFERYIYNYETWARYATLSGSASSTTYASVPNRKYNFRVQADNSVGTSSYAQLSSAIWTTPAAPTSPLRTQGAGADQVLTWALAVGYSEYNTEIWRATGGTYALLATVASGVTTYTDTTALPSNATKYKFRTKTTSGPVLYSSYSAETTETSGTLSAPNAPTNTKPASGIINPANPTQHTWTHNPTDGSAQTAYQVQYRYVGDATWIQTGKITSTAASWTMPADTVEKGRQVQWQVQTWGASASLPSAFSASAVWTTSPVIPVKYPLLLDLTSGRIDAHSTGLATWGTAPLDVSQVGDELSSTYGKEIYLDSNGQLRARPDVVDFPEGFGKLATDLPGTYPRGLSLNTISGAQAVAGGWPLGASCYVLTMLRTEGATAPISGSQFWMRNSATVPSLMYRSGGSGGWSAWVPIIEDTGWITSIASVCVAQSGWSILDASVRRMGKTVYFNSRVQRTGADLAAPQTSSNIAQTPILQMVAAYRPGAGSPNQAIAGTENRLITGYIDASGIVELEAAGGTATIGTGSTIGVGGSYLML